MPKNTPATRPRFCHECATPLVADAEFCHRCGSSVAGPGGGRPAHGKPSPWRWGVPAFAVAALGLISVIRFMSGGAGSESEGTFPLTAAQASDFSSLSPEQRADHLFNRVMRLSSEGKGDSAAFFGPMALAALEALTPLSLHHRYDIGLVALVTGQVPRAKAQGDTILTQRPTHLLGLSLAARAADARGDAAAAKRFRRRLLAAESAERARPLPEYTDHEADVTAAVELARKP